VSMNKSLSQKIDLFYFGVFHVVAFSMIYWAGFRWEFVALCIGSYYLRMFGITAGYHRYFSHRSYKTNRVVQFLLAWLGATAGQKGPLWWASRHRHHHKFSDLPDDVHSPEQHGFWHSHIGWIFDPETIDTDLSLVPDLAKFPELRFLDNNSLLPTITYGLAMYLVFGFGGLVWGYFISGILLYHGTYTINSFCHLFGTRRYVTTDTSRNNLWLALITMGEGWHNNHHYYQQSARQGFFWWEIDASYYVLRVLSWFGLVRKIKVPTPEIRSGNRSLRRLA
jgi:stearoyl-CoA desaturase (delta-9 desaturase)